LESIDSGRDTLEILHMMSDFVRNHVDLAKSPEAPRRRAISLKKARSR
jgi:hypothetical protein